MMLPKEFEARNKLILSYLLAELPEEEIAELDAEMLTQPESLSAFEEGVADIMDAYTDRTLDATSAARVEQLVRLQPSAERQLSFARALKTSRDASIRKIAEARPVGLESSKLRKRVRLLPWTRIRVITAVAAILLVLVTGVFLARRGQVHNTAGEAARLDAAAGAPAATKAAAAPPAFTVILLPTVLRGAPGKAINIPAEANLVRLQAVLPATSTDAVGTLRIENAAGDQIRVFSGLPTQKVETDRYVEASLPAAQLPPGDYRVILTASDGKQIAEYKLARSR